VITIEWMGLERLQVVEPSAQTANSSAGASAGREESMSDASGEGVYGMVSNLLKQARQIHSRPR